jgi:DNA-directed RNA polymerase subunit H (RpoH/RPB5)
MVALTRSSASIAAEKAERVRKTNRIRALANHSNSASIKRYAVKTGKPIYYSHNDIIKIIREEFKSGVRKEYIPIIRDNIDYVLGRKGGKIFSREGNIKYLLEQGFNKAQLKDLSDVDIAKEANTKRGEVVRLRKDRFGRTVKPTTEVISGQLGKTKGSVDDLAKSLATRGQARMYAKTTFAHIKDVDQRNTMAMSKAIGWWDGNINPVNNYRYKGMKDMPDGAEWRRIAKQIKDHNDQIVRNYAHAGKVAPQSALLQAHHLQPLGYGGGNPPQNIRMVLGDVLRSPESRHALLHPKSPEHFYNKVYSMLQKQGHDVAAFIPDDPNLRGANARYLQSVLSDISGGGGGKDIWKTIKPFAQTAGKTFKNVHSLGGLLSLPVAIAGALAYPDRAEAIQKAAAAPFDLPGVMLGLYDEKPFSRGGPQENWQTGRGWQQSLLDPNWRGDR